MRSIKLLLSIVLLTIVSFSFAQKKLIAKADDHYAKYEFHSALEIYESINDKKKTDEVKVKIANCYRRLNNWEKTEKWYSMVSDKTVMSHKDHYHYAESLENNGKFEEAKEWFEMYHKEEPDDRRGELKLYGIEHMRDFYKDSVRYKINNMDLNSEQSEFGARLYKNGMVFSSNREHGQAVNRRFKWDNSLFLDLYFAERNEDGTYEEAKPFSNELNTRYHEGPFDFNADFTKIAFTRNTYHDHHKEQSQEGIQKMSIYFAEWDGKEWTNETGFPFNDKEYSVQHPALNKDFTKIVFTSDRPGGMGGADLWMSEKVGGTWIEPVNLGDSVNTEGNEAFPFLHEDGSLFFSSDGRDGLGGFDIYEAKYENGQYYNVHDLGYPINTFKDDIGYTVDNERRFGYFSSNRDGGLGGDDIYKFEYLGDPKIKVLGTTWVKNEGEPDSAKRLLPLTDVKALIASNDSLVESLVSDSAGKFLLELDKGEKYKLVGSKADLEDAIVMLNLIDKDNNKAEQVDLVLIVPRRFVEFKAIVHDKETNEPLKNATVTIKNAVTKEEKVYSTDANGHIYTQLELSTAYVLRSSKSGYTSDCMKINTPDTASHLTPERPLFLEKIKGMAKIELKNVYFDFDKANIRKDAGEELDRLITFLKKYPELKVELGVHTDARGSDKYNQALSQRRANSTVKYLVDNGVKKENIVAVGYGETQLVNHCKNGVKCDDKTHEENRRVEAKFTNLDEVEANFAADLSKVSTSKSGDEDADCGNVELIYSEDEVHRNRARY